MLTENGKRLLERWIYVQVRVDKEFLVPYMGAALQRIEAAPDYGAEFAPFLRRFLEALAGEDWRPGTYYPGGWYRRLTAGDASPAAAEIVPAALGPFYQEELVVDRRGRWWMGDKPIGNRVRNFFLGHLSFDPELGRYAIRYRLGEHFERRYLHHRAPPFRVVRVTRNATGAMLRLNDGRHEPLRPETLHLDQDEHLYCGLDGGGVPAWFEEPARWELLKDAEERDGAWVVRVGGRETVLRPGSPWPFAHPPPAAERVPEPGTP
jgi:hypothetical protein